MSFEVQTSEKGLAPSSLRHGDVKILPGLT